MLIAEFFCNKKTGGLEKGFLAGKKKTKGLYLIGNKKQ
jgi:hypothetical protein